MFYVLACLDVYYTKVKEISLSRGNWEVKMVCKFPSKEKNK